MCRLTAIITRGEPILLADILTRPRRSIIQQSFNCQERLPQDDIRNAYQKASLNGDGFGVGWYITKGSNSTIPGTSLSLLRACNSNRNSTNGKTVPDSEAAVTNDSSFEDDGGACVFTSLKPAWADRNLYNLAEKISSRLFFAHVRAASSTLGWSQCTGCAGGLPPWAVANGSVSTELCCHPFRCGRFMFMHNGSVGGFNKIRRDLLSLLPDPMFSFAITNSCIDSACLFAVFLALLPNSPTERSTHSAMKEAVEQMIATICWLLDKEKIEEITLINIVVSDGESIVATRFVTNAQEVAYESGKSSTVPDMTGETSPAMPASLYFATGTAWQQQEETCGEFRMTHRDKRTDICIVTSEPLTSNPEDWMPVPRNTMILITPAIDLLLYPIASVGYLPSPLRRRRSSVFLGSTQETSLPPFDKQITLRKGLAESLANRIEGDFESLLEIASSGGSMGTPGVSDELAVMMLRSMENIVREVAAGIEPCDKEERDKAWQALKIKLERLEKQIQAAQVQRQAVAAVEDGQSHSTCGSSTMSSGIPSTNLYHADLNSETLGASQQCYELIAGSCAILCLETIMIYVTNSNEETERDLSSAASASPCLPVVAKTFVFAGMQSGEVVVYDATSASVAPISFQAHEGGVLAMAVHANTLRNGSLGASQNIACKDCGSVVPEIFLVTGGSDTSLAVWDLSPLVFGGREPRLLSGIQVLLDGPRISIAADDLLAVRLTFLPHQGDVLSLLVSDCSGHGAHTTGSRHDPSRRICTVSACDACMQGIRAAMRLDSSGGVSNEYTPSSPVAALHCTADLHKVQPSPFIEDRGCNILLFIGFQSAKIGAVFLSDLLRYFRHTQVMVSVLANAVSFQPAQQQSLSLRVSRDFELKTLASGQVKVQFSGEQERESLGSLFTGGQKCAGSRQQAGRSPIQQGGSASCSPCLSSGLAKYEAFGRLLSGFARSLRCVTLHASHAATTFWSTKCCRSRRPGCLYPPTGTVYCFEAPHELEVPLPEGAAASASPGTYRVVTSTSSLKIVAQPSRKDGGLKIEMRFLPFEQSGVQRQHSHQSLVGPWLDESGHNGFVECLTSCGKGVICSGGGDGRLLLWGENGSLVGELSGHHGGVLCVAYTEAPVESLCRELRNSGERLHITSPQAECTRDSDEVGHSLQGLLFSGSRDSSIRVWALEQFVCIQTLNAHTSEVLALAADASRNILISGSANGELFVWQLDLMVVAFQLSLNPSPSFAESGHFSCTAAHHAFGPCSHEGQERGVSFTGLLLVSDASFFSEHISGSAERSLGAAFASCGKGPGGLQLWAGRGDGKLGVWNINERDLGDEGSVGEDHVKPTSCEGSPACDFAVTETNGPTEGSADKKDTAGEALQNAVSPANAENGAADGSREGTRAIPMNAQRLLCANRLSGMVITPGASMPSLPSLTMKTGLEPRRRDFLPLLAQFVAYKSVSASRCPRHVTGCIGAAKFVAQLLEQALGATVDIVWPQRSAVLSEFHGDQWEGQPHPVVFGRLGTNPHHPTIVFYSHYDVVSAGGTSPSSVPASSDVSEGSASPVTVSASPRTRTRTAVPPSNQQGARSSSNSVTQMTKHQGARSNSPGWHGTGWHTNPWKIHCKDGYIYGRGVTDNKGPIICSLLAVKHFISEWRRKYKASQALYERCSQHLDSGEASATQNPAPVKSDPAIPFNFVWICEGDEENGSVGLADAVAQKASWLHGARFLICNNSYWADDVTPCLVYGMRGVLDIRVEATGGAEDSGYHSGVHGGAVEEPMQSLVQLLSQMYDPSTGRVKIPRFYDAVQPPDYAELQRVKAAADSVKTGWVQRASAGGTSDPNELLRKSWLEPSMSLLGIDASLKGKCPHAGGAMRVIPSTVCAEISLRLVPQQGPKEIFTLIRDYLQESFKKASSASKLAVQCLRQGRSWRADLNAPRTRALYGAAHAAIKEVWGVEPLYVREGGSMPAIPFLADAFRRLPGPLGQCQGSDEVAVCQLPFGQASDNAHLPNERLGIRQVEKGVDVLACTLESLAARLAESTSRPVVAL